MDTEVKPLVMELKNQIQTNGKINPITSGELFEKLWTNGQRIDSTMNDEYYGLADRLKNLNINLNIELFKDFLNQKS